MFFVGLLREKKTCADIREKQGGKKADLMIRHPSYLSDMRMLMI